MYKRQGQTTGDDGEFLGGHHQHTKNKYAGENGRKTAENLGGETNDAGAFGTEGIFGQKNSGQNAKGDAGEGANPDENKGCLLYTSCRSIMLQLALQQHDVIE